MTYSFSIFLLSSFTMTFITLFNLQSHSLLIVATRKRIWLDHICKLVSTVYWIINAAVVLVAFPKALKRKKGGYATWSSPDRGNTQR